VTDDAAPPRPTTSATWAASGCRASACRGPCAC